MYYHHKKVLVTGGASFIGSHLVDALVASKATVAVVDDLSSGLRENLQHSMAQINFIEADLRDPQVVNEATKGQDIVFHLANIRGGRGYIDTHPGDIVQNFVIDGHVFRYAHLNSVERVCYTSSACAYPVNLQADGQQICYLSEEMADPFTPSGALADGEYGWGVRLILRSKLGKMTVDEKCPEMLPAIAQDERSKCKNSLAAINGPSHA